MQEQVQNANPFADKIKEIILASNADGSLETSILSINEKLKSVEPQELTSKEFILLGGMSYYVGLDFCQQPILDKKIVNKFVERFKIFNFSEATINAFQEIISNENIIQGIEIPKDLLKEEVLDTIKATQLEINDTRILINTIFKNSIFPSIYSHSINEIMNTKKYTYHDIITINNILQQNINVKGSQFKNLIKLYGNKTFTKALADADTIFNNSKFAIVYYDSIISCVECQKRFEGTNITNFLQEGFIDTYDFEIEANKEKTEEVKDVENDENEKRIARENELNILQNKHPRKFIVGVLCDFLKVTKFENPVQIIEAIENAGQNQDYIQHIYHYLKANQEKAHQFADGESLADDFGLTTEQVEEVRSIIVDKIAELRGETKALTEILLKELPAEKLPNIINYVNNVIESLVVFGMNEKGYLLSQIQQNQISTYQHLQQILSIVESQNIDGSKINNYVVLYDYLETQTDVKTVFENTGKLEGMYNKLAFYQEIRNFFFPVTKEKEENKEEVVEDTQAKVDLKVEIKDAQ